jgi:hypothetical protein
MREMDIPENCIIAEGPEGLSQVLDILLVKTKQDPIFAAQEHNILYQLGSQKSLIKVDTSSIPFKFQHFDLMGRPATMAVKDTIGRFLWEKCGGEEWYIKEVFSKSKNKG